MGGVGIQNVWGVGVIVFVLAWSVSFILVGKWMVVCEIAVGE